VEGRAPQPAAEPGARGRVTSAAGGIPDRLGRDLAELERLSFQMVTAITDPFDVRRVASAIHPAQHADLNLNHTSQLAWLGA